VRLRDLPCVELGRMIKRILICLCLLSATVFGGPVGRPVGMGVDYVHVHFVCQTTLQEPGQTLSIYDDGGNGGLGDPWFTVRYEEGLKEFDMWMPPQTVTVSDSTYGWFPITLDSSSVYWELQANRFNVQAIPLGDTVNPSSGFAFTAWCEGFGFGLAIFGVGWIIRMTKRIPSDF